jgi:CRISPR/Cas system-associated exonuclease Cas4 (RecB family)
MALGSMEHASASIVFKKVKSAQSCGGEMNHVAEELEAIASCDESATAALWSDNNLDNIEKYCSDAEISYQDTLPEYLAVVKEFLLLEANRLRQKYPLTNTAPAILAIEEYIDGYGLGVNRGKIDCLLRLSDGSIMICDMKRKSWGDNHDGKIQIAGYALAMEKEYHIPVSVGCLVFSSTLPNSGKEPEREIFAINDNYRGEFISMRDKAIQIASGRHLPPIPNNAEWKCKGCDARESCSTIK